MRLKVFRRRCALVVSRLEDGVGWEDEPASENRRRIVGLTLDLVSQLLDFRLALFEILLALLRRWKLVEHFDLRDEDLSD